MTIQQILLGAAAVASVTYTGEAHAQQGASLTLPGSTGDLMVMFLNCASTDVTSFSGWTMEANIGQNAQLYYYRLYSRVRQGGDSTITVPGTNGHASVLSFSGTGTLSVAQAGTRADCSSASSLSAPAITPTKVSSIVAAFCDSRDVSTPTFTTGGFTTATSWNASYFGVLVGYKKYNSTSSTGTVDFAVSNLSYTKSAYLVEIATT